MKAFKIFAVAALGLIMASCGGSTPTAEEVAAKVESKAELSNKDYQVMIDYCGDYAEKAQRYFDIINEEPNDSTQEAIKATDDLASLYANAKYLDLFRNVIFNSDAAQMGSANAEKAAELAKKYEAFPVPAVSTDSLLNPQVVGEVIDMPSVATTDSTGELGQAEAEVVK